MLRSDAVSEGSAERWGHRFVVGDSWIDYNGHMTIARYAFAFDAAVDEVLDALELGGPYRAAFGCSIFVGEVHTVFHSEAVLGESLEIATWLAAFDAKRALFRQQMAQADGGRRVATHEALCLHVDLAARKVVAWPEAALARLARAAATPTAGRVALSAIAESRR